MTRSPTSTDRTDRGQALVRYLPGALGAALIVAGVTFAWGWPFGLIALGAFGLLIDRRVS